MKSLELRIIRSEISNNITKLQDAYNVKIIGIFGSVVRGDCTKQSDVDIMVEFSKPIGFFKFIELENFLSRILKRKVDLVSRKALKPSIKRNILREVEYL